MTHAPEAMASPGGIAFAGGGTGGHIFPTLAVIEALGDSAPTGDAAEQTINKCHVFCSSKALDDEILTRAGVAHTPLPVCGWSSRPWTWPRFGWRLYRSVRQARLMLDDLNVAVVMAMGGYVAGPVALAAKQRGLPVVLVNLDARAGRANRRLARRADRVFSVHDQPGLPTSHERIGFPVRRAAIADQSPAACRRALGLDPDRPVLLVTGASLGARTINEAMTDLLRREETATLLAGWQILHLAGDVHAAAVRADTADAPMPVRVMPFLQRMGLAWGAASLAISRSGAGSAAEVLVNAVPTLFLPYPYHADEHQRHNALPLEAAGGAVVLTDTTEARSNADQLLDALRRLLSERDQLDAMRAALRAQRDSRPPGAARLAETIRQILAHRSA